MSIVNKKTKTKGKKGIKLFLLFLCIVIACLFASKVYLVDAKAATKNSVTVPDVGPIEIKDHQTISNSFEAKEKMTVGGICEVGLRYGWLAFSEKNNTNVSAKESFDAVSYMLANSVESSDLSQLDIDKFFKFIWNIYLYVYNSDGLTEDNLDEKILSYCELNIAIAWVEVDTKTSYCKEKGLLYEMLSKHKLDGEDIGQVLSVYKGLLSESDRYEKIKSVLNNIYYDGNYRTVAEYGEKAYSQCLLD